MHPLSTPQHKRLEPECVEAVNERMRQAASHLDFNPELVDNCAAELHLYCKAKHLQGAAAVDCLADNRWVEGRGRVWRGLEAVHVGLDTQCVENTSIFMCHQGVMMGTKWPNMIRMVVDASAT